MPPRELFRTTPFPETGENNKTTLPFHESNKNLGNRQEILVLSIFQETQTCDLWIMSLAADSNCIHEHFNSRIKNTSLGEIGSNYMPFIVICAI